MAVALVEVGQDLRVATTREHMAVRAEYSPDLVVVVELAVLNCDNGAVLTRDRLMAAEDIYDRQPANPRAMPGAE